MKSTSKQIIALVDRIRDGHPPKLPDGKFEEFYLDPALPTFGVRVLSTGRASWCVQSKRLGRQQKITIGDVRVIDRPQAIEAARNTLAKIQLGILDPQEAKREAMRIAKVTFESQVSLFLEYQKRKGLRESTIRYTQLYLTGYYFRPLHKLPLDEITGAQISTQIDKIISQSGNEAAGACHKSMRGLFSWAIKTGKLPADRVNPMGTVEQPQKNKSRDRVLTNEEIALIWKACEDWEAEVLRDDEDHAKTGKRHKAGVRSITDFSRAVRLLFVTGMRPQEIGDLQWAEVDLDNGEICIPETRMKTKEELANPLSDMAVKILRGVAVRPDKACVFGQGNKSGTGLDTNGVNNKINRRIERAGGVPPKNWTPHDIRRTFRTRLSEIGVQNDVAEALLGHAIGNKIKRTYDRYHHWPEKRAALARWEDKLRAIIAGTAEKVVAPRFGQRRSAS